MRRVQHLAVARIEADMLGVVEEDQVTGLECAHAHPGSVVDLRVRDPGDLDTGLRVRPLREARAVVGVGPRGATDVRLAYLGGGRVQRGGTELEAAAS